MLALTAGAARAELTPGWSVDIFAGRIVDIAPGGGVLAGATDGGLLFHDPLSGAFQQIADAGCTDGDCLRSNRLTAVTRDASGQYWVGTEQAGVAALRPVRGGWEYSHFFTASLHPGGGLLSDVVTAIAAWQSDAVYVGTPQGVAQIDLAGAVGEYNEESSRRRGVDGFPDAAVNDLAVDPTFVWVATDAGMVRYQRVPPHDVETLADSLNGARALCVVILNGRVFAGTDVGVHLWDESARRWRRIRNAAGVPEPTPSFHAYSIAILPDPNPQILRLFVGSDADVRAYNGFAWARCSPPGIPLVESRAFPALVATGDTLWTSQVNANGEGGFLERLVPGQGCAWQRRQPSAIPPSEVRFVDMGADGETLWIGTQLGGVAQRTPDGIWCAFNGNDPNVAANMSDPNGVESFLADRGGAAWFSRLPIDALAPVDKLVPASGCAHASDVWEHIAPGERGFGGRYWKIAEDGSGNRFFLSDGDPSPGGLDVLSADELRVGNVRANLLDGSAVGGIAFNRAAGDWTEAYVGVNNLAGQGLRLWRNPGDPNNIFNPVEGANLLPMPLGAVEVAEYRDLEYDGATRDLWMGTNAGVFRYDVPSRLVELQLGEKRDAKPGLLSANVRDLLLDDRGNLWIATELGLNRIRVRDSVLAVDAFSTGEAIEARNAGASSQVGVLYLPERTLAPLPSADVLGLAYDSGRHRLHIGTAAGLASVDVDRLDARAQVPIEKAFVYPNPVRALNAEAAIYVADVSLPARVTVYNLEGEIVSEKLVTAPGVQAWDLKVFIQEGGSQGAFLEAASGVYMVRVDTDTGTKVAPLVVIR